MKNKILILIGMFACFAVHAETDYIDIQIHELQQRRDALQAELDACEENTRKFKIAGVATLGATGVGVVGNIALHNEIKKIEQSKNGSGYSGGAARFGFRFAVMAAVVRAVMAVEFKRIHDQMNKKEMMNVELYTVWIFQTKPQSMDVNAN